MKNIQVFFVSKTEIQVHVKEKKLPARFARTKTVTGSRTNHAFAPGPNNTLFMRVISKMTKSNVREVFTS